LTRLSRGRWLPVLVSLLAVSMLTAGCARRPPTEVGTTFPPPAPTRSVDPDKAITGLIAALGPDEPMRLHSTSRIFVGDGILDVIMDGDFQGNEMDAKMSIRNGSMQLTFFVIAADGKGYVRTYNGKWEKSPEKVPADGSGPFGKMVAEDFRFEGKAKSDPGLYTIVWDEPTHAGRALDGTALTKVDVKGAQMMFDVTSTGTPHSATYVMTGTGTSEGKKYTLTINGFYQFFRIHDPLVFEAPVD
jgi:hypothetical protein